MRLSSIRARVLYLAGVFSLLLVGSVTLATYFFVADGMSRSAQETTWRLTQVTSHAIARTTTTVKLDAAAKGLEGVERESEAQRQLLRAIPDVLGAGGAEEGAYAFYIEDESGAFRLVWYSDEAGVNNLEASRRLAIERQQPIQSGPRQAGAFTGMFTSADLGTYIVHIPLTLPDRTRGILDVVYIPDKEEAILDSARAPMLIVAVFSLLIAVFMTQIIMGWVLSLVDDVRVAADSIDAGQLDVSLPEEGEHEIARLAHVLNNLMNRLRIRAEAQTRFIADASHELATPVAGIRGYISILREWGSEDPVTRDEAIAAIDRESRRMARLCSDLLSMIRSDEMLQYRHVRYDINALSREVLATMATRYMDKNLEFIGPDEGPLWAMGDPDRIEEVFGILLDNAGKYTTPGGSVVVETHKQRDRVIVEVTDTGIGIPEADLPNVFERFYRSDTSRSKDTGGFGLGLAIAKHIVDMSQGEISVSSRVGEGTTFLVILPRTRSKE
ncbi:MAG: HAMP domain-containing sensor histidine kinase [Coriobacteriia bacterium]|nr:HAMP domain-containing sensor histidine kinase [Coriobacteriia bacterium]